MFDTAQEYVSTLDFLALDKELMIVFLASDQLTISEIDLFNAVLK